MSETHQDTNLFLSRQFGRSYRVIKALNARYLAELGYNDFKIGHCMVMLNLESGGITSAEIAKKVSVSKQAMSKLIQELIEKDFVQAIKHPQDHRATLIRSTDEGLRFLEALMICRKKVEMEMNHVIGEEKLNQLHLILREILDHYQHVAGMDLQNESIAQTRLK
jgi:DNA-binding MarR family transcriptional regulator